MAKAKSVFVCQECAASQPRWSGKCPSCGAWNSLVEEQTVAVAGSARPAAPLAATTISDVGRQAMRDRLGSGMAEIDQVLGGGIVPGSVVLLAGQPGIGKSTLLLQLAAGVASAKKVLYVSGEESLHQVSLRARRLGITAEGLSLAGSTDADSAAASIASGQYELVIVDSIQTMALAGGSSAAGTISQITNSARVLQAAAKTSHSALLLVGHVTKEGNIAGPKILEHLVDVVLYLEGDARGGFRILRGVKNRFGATHEVAIFEMQERGLVPVANPSAALLAERQAGDGSVVFPSLEGSRALLVEVQALVNTSVFGYPKRTAVGFDLNRLNLLVAVLERRASVKLADKDIYINVVGGVSLHEPAADLAVALAVASAAKRRPVREQAVVFGEVGLSGEIRSIASATQRLGEARKMGFQAAIAPIKTATAPAITNLAQAITAGLTK